jgi:hypothetical protein
MENGIMLKQYFTHDGIIEREQTQEELDVEFQMQLDSPQIQMILNTLIELNPGKTEEEIIIILKSKFLG